MAGNLIYAGAQWLVVVLLARLGTSAMVGQYALALAIVTPVIWFVNFALRAILATDVRDEFRFGHYLALRLLGCGVALIVVSGLVSVSGYARQTQLIIVALCLSKLFDFASDIFYGVAQRHERMDRVGISLMAQGLLQATVLAIVVKFSGSVLFGIVGMGVASAAVTIFYDLNTARLLARTDDLSRIVPNWDWPSLGRLMWLGLPLGVVLGLNSLIANVPRYVLADRLGERQVGIFAAMIYLAIAGQYIVGAVGESASPRLASLFAFGHRRQFRLLVLRLVGAAVAVGAAGFVVSLVLGKEALSILYGKEYAASASTFVYLMAGSGPLYAAGILGVSMNAMRGFHAQVPFRLLHLVAMWFLCVALIDRNGLVGAGQAFMWSCILFFASMAILVAVYERIHGDRLSTTAETPLQSVGGPTAIVENSGSA